MRPFEQMICVFIMLLSLFALIILLYKPLFKRVFDILFSGIAIVVFSPLLLLVAILVACKLGKPVLFSQNRPGKHGKIFKMYKFRTMTNERDAGGKLLPDEARMTPFGKFLRSASLDELPELFDIFIGKMSIIGPRPLLVQYLPLYTAKQARRHEVRPGLTGLAQVNGRNAISWEQKFELDVKYVDSISFFNDLKILFKTVFTVFARKGINQEGQATMEAFTGGDSQAMKEYNVLILSAGRRVELVKSFIAARDKTKTNGKVIVADASEEAPALFFGEKRFTIPRVDDAEYIDRLKGLIEGEKISLVIPTIDTELDVLLAHRAELEAGGCRVMVCDAASLCHDKIAFAKLLESNNIPCPKSYTIQEALLQGDYPYFIKPKNGSSSINSFKVENATQLEFFGDYVSQPIVQKYAEGVEYTIDALYDFEGNALCVVPRVRLAVRGGEILRGKIEKNQVIIDAVANLARLLKPIGMITYQGKLTSDGFSFIEVNARFGGGAPMSIKEGADFPSMLYRLIKGEKVEYFDGYEEGLVMRFDDSVLIK